MKDGILYNADTMDEIWPIYKKCPEWKLKHNPKADTTNNQPNKQKDLHENSEDDE